MFDNIAFSVAIGLVLIYLLYSLLVTILGEMLSSWLGIRPRMLRMALARMLNDGATRQNAFSRFFLRTPKNFDRTFAGKFYAYPSIKYLSKLEKNEKWLFGHTKPAYISAENFAITLINMFADKGTGSDKLEKVRFCLRFNTLRIEQETRRHLINLLSDSGNNINEFGKHLARWFNETMDRTNGWYKNKLKFISFWIGFLLALFFNVNTIYISKILANDKDARQQLVNMGIQLAKDSARYDAFTSKSNDSLRNKASLDSGISLVTKDISYANMILGLGWGTDRLEEPKTLTLLPEDSLMYIPMKALVDQSYRLNKQHEEARVRLITIANNLEHLQRDRFILRQDTIILSRNLQLAIAGKDKIAIRQAKIDLDTAQKKLLVLDQRLAENSVSFKKDSLMLMAVHSDLHEMSVYADSLLGGGFLRIDSISTLAKNNDKVIVAGVTGYNIRNKILYTLEKAIQLDNLAGLLLTALALSLGAPFWFDLLKNLVAIRSVGVKPEEKKVSEEEMVKIGDTPARSIPPVIADVVEKAMALYATTIRNIPGVQSIFPVYVKHASNFIQANVDAVATQQVVQAKFSQLDVNGIQVTLIVVVTGVARQHGSPRIISNQHRPDIIGSLGCILIDRNANEKHLISCFHVLSGTTQYDVQDEFTTILDIEKKLLGMRDAGGIEASFDYGLAKVFPERMGVDNVGLFQALGITRSQHRAVSNDDLLDQVQIKFFDMHTGAKKTGFLYTKTPAYTIKYEDKNRELTNLLVLTGDLSQHVTISRDGNSGAIIFTEDNAAIGMIVAGDKQYTYAMQLSCIFDIHKELTIVN